MKKTSINLLCILIICILSFSVLMPVYMYSYAFCAGFAGGWEDNSDAMLTRMSPIEMTFEPSIEQITNPSDSIYFDDGRSYPMVMRQAMVMIPDREVPQWTQWLSFAIYFACLVLTVTLLVSFIRFIININRGKIFEPSNISRLRRFGWYLLSIALLEIANGIIAEYSISALGVAIDGYSAAAYWVMPWSNLLISLVALLMAQIWAYGFDMRREQELTI